MNTQWIWRGENGRCSQVWTAVRSRALKAVHRVMREGWEGGSLTTLWDVIKDDIKIRRIFADVIVYIFPH